MLFGIYWCLTANRWFGNGGYQTPTSNSSTWGACQNQDVGEVRRWQQMGRKIHVRWHPDRWAPSTNVSDVNQILVSSLMKLSRSGEHNLSASPGRDTGGLRTGTGKHSACLRTMTCSFLSHEEAFLRTLLQQVNSLDHVFWQWINAEWEFTHDPIIKFLKKDL